MLVVNGLKHTPNHLLTSAKRYWIKIIKYKKAIQ